MTAVVAQTPDSAENDYGLRRITVANTAGNTLAVFVGWNATGLAKNPVSSVADDAHNWWTHLKTSAGSGTAANVRGAVWVATNAQVGDAVSGKTVISVGTTLPTLGLAISVVEFSGMPVFPTNALTAGGASNWSNSTAGLTVNAVASGPAWGFGLAATSNNTATITAPGNTGLNFLTGQNTGFEGGLGNWTVINNCTIADSAAQAHSGVNSLAMTSSAAGAMTIASCAAGSILTQGMPVVPGDLVTVTGWLRAATAARTCNIGIDWYNSAGTYLSTTNGANITDSTTAWTQATGISLVAPANAAEARVTSQVVATGAAGEVHYIDDVVLLIPWHALTTVSINDPGGIGGTGDIQLTPVWANLPAGSAAAAYTSSGNLSMAVVMAGILQTPVLPTQIGAVQNANFPVIKVEAAFGSLPGDPTAMPVWTDVTARALDKKGSVVISSSRGRDYELAAPEAGSLAVMLDNHDGAFTPGNSSSPYYPNVQIQTPLRAWAFWPGTNLTKGLGYGQVRHWPQNWPTGQWGMSKVGAVDSIGVLAGINLKSPYQREILLEGNLYSYWPGAENYSSGKVNGLPFRNLALGNSGKPMIGMDFTQATNPTQLETGLNLLMQGDGGRFTGEGVGTGIGISKLTTVSVPQGAGAICVDPNYPSMNGLTVEFWAMLPTNPGVTAYSTPLVSLIGNSPNYPLNAGAIRFSAQAQLAGGVNRMQTLVGDFPGNSFTDTGGSFPADGNIHHHVFTLSFGTNWTVAHYLDGVLDHTFTTSTVINSSDFTVVIVGGPLIFPLGAFTYNYTIGHIAIYSTILNPQRILQHSQIGNLGNVGDTAVGRFKRIITWGQSGLPKAASPDSPTPAMSAAGGAIVGQGTVPVFGHLMISEGGQIYADGAGNVTYKTRTAFYNKTPKWTFGDNPALGEIPYSPGAGFRLDSTHLYSQVTAKRIAAIQQKADNQSFGSSVLDYAVNGAIVYVEDATAESQYQKRNGIGQTIYANTDEDVYDRANWTLNKYKTPQQRCPSITLNPAAYPSIWPTALAIEQGDIVKIIRRPVGAPVFTMTGIVQKVEWTIGPGIGKVKLAISPYDIEGAVLHIGDSSNDTLAQTIAW